MTTDLFKRRKDGKIQRTTVELCDVFARYRTVTCQGYVQEVESRLIDFVPIESSVVTSEWTKAEPKNVGRSNETTARQQAESEVKSKIQKMIDNGYVDHPSMVDCPTIKKVAMLAKPADLDRVAKEIDKTGYVYVQPKLDGIRCIATAQGLFARSGKRIVGMTHIEEELESIFEEHPELMLDGELYNHDLRDNFDEIVSAVRKEKNLDPEQAKKIQYHVYDNIHHEAKMSERWQPSYFLSFMKGESIKMVKTRTEVSEKFVTIAHEQFISEGYEGTMIRYDAPYQTNKRNWSLQKLKQFQDAEFKIVDFEEGRGKASGLACKVVIQANLKEVRPTMMGTEEFRKQVWEEKDQYIGGVATVKYFGVTKDGSLRFPNAKMVFKAEQGRDL